MGAEEGALGVEVAVGVEVATGAVTPGVASVGAVDGGAGSAAPTSGRFPTKVPAR